MKKQENQFVVKVPKPHSNFLEYGVLMGVNDSLCFIIARSEILMEQVEGKKLKFKYLDMVEKLNKIYGKSLEVNKRGKVKRSTFETFITHISDKRKENNPMFTVWDRKTGSKMKNNIGQIRLLVESERTPNSLHTGWMTIQYYFSNYSSSNEIISKEDESL